MRRVAAVAAHGAALAAMACTAGPGAGPISTVHGLPAVPSVATDTPRIRLAVGDRIRIRYDPGTAGFLRAYDDSPHGATYEVSAPGPVTVNATGLVTAVDTGTVLVGGRSPADPAARAFVEFEVVRVRRAVNLVAVEVCPNEDESRLLASEPLTERVQRIHEFHDCQRLMTDDDDYGPVVGIFAHANDTIPDRMKFTDGKLVAVIVNFMEGGSGTEYSHLGLIPGTNCLVLKWETTPPRRWRAGLVYPSRQRGERPSAPYEQCRDDLTWRDVADADTGRFVVEEQHGFSPDTVGRKAPPVARWDWDAEAEKNYIGIRCDSITWCEIGPRGLSPSAALMRGQRPIIKGYYDQQYLANKAGDEPTITFATIKPWSDDDPGGPRLPHDRAALRDIEYVAAEMDFEKSNFLPSPAYNRYRQYYVSKPSWTDWLSSWTGRADRSVYRLRVTGSSRVKPTFKARFNNLESNVVYRWHGSMEHLRDTPVVRWRWAVDDERTWAYCVDGCCEDQARSLDDQ